MHINERITCQILLILYSISELISCVIAVLTNLWDETCQWSVATDPDQSLGVLTRPMDLPQVDQLEAETSLVGRHKPMALSPQLCPNLQESFGQAEHKDELSQDMQPYFGKLEQGESLVCPESIQQSGEHVDGLIFYQTMEEETQMEKTTGDIVGATGNPGNNVTAAPVCLSEQVEEITERQMDHEPFMDGSLVQSCDEMTDEKAVQHLDAGATVMELESIYSGYTHHSSPATSAMTPPITSLSEEDTTKINKGVKTEESVGQETYESVGEDENLAAGIIKCKIRTLLRDHNSQEDDLPQDETEMTPVSPPNAKSSCPSVFDSDCGDKPQELQLPVKTEETERESIEDIYPDSSDVKQGSFLSAVKTEDVVTKDEQLDYPIKAETLESKSELASVSVKPERLDFKPEVYSAFSGGAKLKTETQPEALDFTTYPDSSEEKCKAKAEPLELTLPGIKGKIKQELLEADSTVLTPKLEQTDGLVDAAASLAAKGQVKKLCGPGKGGISGPPYHSTSSVCKSASEGEIVGRV